MALKLTVASADPKGTEMSPAPPSHPIYLETLPDRVFGFFHPPAASASGEFGQGTAVLLCPPFGWEDVASYRSRRYWAQVLAAEGHATLRIDLPGAGDSAGSPRDPDRLGAWTAAVAGSAAWLHAREGDPRVVAVGWGLGGLLACLAAGHEAPIDDLVLWGVPARGRRLVRELRAFAAMKAAEYDEREPSDLGAASADGDDGALAVAGFVLTADTLRALEQVDLTTLTLTGEPARRVLLLQRDGLPVDEALRDRLKQLGAAVSTAPGDGYGALLAGPQESVPPVAVFDAVSSWLGQGPARGRRQTSARAGTVSWPVPPARDELELAAQPSSLREELDLSAQPCSLREVPITVERPEGRLFGLLCEPIDGARADIAVVLLNAGVVRRIGPNRMWVEAARRWASLGVPTLRLDVEGLGDSDGDGSRYVDAAALYAPGMVDQVRVALDHLQAEGVASRFVVAGVCSGALWAFNAVCEDERVTCAVMVNSYAFFWADHLIVEREARRVGRVLQLSAWRRVLHGKVSAAHVLARLRWMLATPLQLRARSRRRRAGRERLVRALDGLRDSDRRLVLLLGRGELLWDELARDGHLDRLAGWPNVELHTIPSPDHTFRAPPLQRHVHDALDQVLRTELDRRLSHDEPSRPGTRRAARSVAPQPHMPATVQ